ncbi:MAG: type III pantothenate kinase [Anaerolineaceae bacterium]|nr:type III pantothenate kinase [Anaerolineaceae bacterium]
MIDNNSGLLAIDLGNTNLTIGLFRNSKLTEHWRLSTDHKRMQDEYGLQFLGLLNNKEITPTHFSGIILSSVVPPLTERVVQACEAYLGQSPIIVSSDLKLNVKILYDDPMAVGADRIADAVATKALFSNPACVIDFGTATTFNAINKANEYLGGAILPGIGLSAEMLFERTAKLTSVELCAPPSVIGTNTRHAIQSGLIFGYVALVEGMVTRFKQELGDETIVIATGGHVHRISSYTNVIDHIKPWLTLEGLRIIWEMNR